MTTKILLFNVGYCTGIDGSLRGYLLHFLRYLYTPRRVFHRVLRSIERVVQRENPDLCCFVEVRRMLQFIHHFPAYPFHDFENKYGLHSLWRKLPYFRKNCIAFFARRALPFRKVFLSSGAKKLLYEIQLNEETSLLVGHFSLRRRIRRKQLQEVERLIGKRKRVILCGDFNVFRGMRELLDLIDKCRLKIVNTLHDLTFPAAHPHRALDLFLCSEDIDICSLKVLHTHASDHLPVVLEVAL